MNAHVRLKKVPQHFIDVVFGYLRRLSCIDMDKLPNDVIHIIIFYHYLSRYTEMEELRSIKV